MSDDFVKQNFSAEDVAWHNKEEALLEEMGITRNEADKLRRTMISAGEAVHAKSEELTRIRQHKGRKPNWLEFVDSKARMGQVLPACEVIRRFKSIVPQLRCADGRIRGTVAMFAPVVRTYEDGFHPGWDYIGSIQSDWSPEYEIDLVDEDGVPRGRKHGWRTPLLTSIIRKDGTGRWMLKSQGIVQDGTGLPLKIITEDQALRAFGHPTNGATASSYRRQLWEFRNGKRVNAVAWT
jgi:hypothetical protein